LKALFDHLSLRTGVIGGVSMGAGVAAAFGRLWPQLTSGLIMIRPAWIERAHTSNLRLFPMLARALENGIEAARQAIENTPEFRRLRENSPGAAVSILQQLEKPRARERRRRLFEMPDSCPVESWEQISTFPHPALVIGTHDDPIHPYEFAEAWARRIRGARLAEVPPKWPRANDHSLAVRQKVGAFLRFLNECGVAEAIAGR
jgi:pimeloyl-ACP methyl ester carboxylesterase